MVEVGGETLVLLVVIFIRDAPFNGGRSPVPRTEAPDLGWTRWRGHDIAVYLIEFYTCPRVLRIGSPSVLYVCRWKGKYVYALSKDLVADQILHGEKEVRSGRRVVAVGHER